MEFAARQTLDRHRAAATANRCPLCSAQALVLLRRHVSPPNLGPTLVTEYYDCDYCCRRFQFTPAENRWRPIAE